jgi:dTDP-4-dehydrorhamnose 3,5-epimerase
MKLTELSIPGVYEIDLFHAEDERGDFVKTFQSEEFRAYGLVAEFHESFYSNNKQNVIRGMHFQHPPHDHAKLVYATNGIILDVILDLRKSSESYGQFTSVEISGENHKAVYMPAGVAHGFCCLTKATMVYHTSTIHNPASDDGVRWDSFGMNWPVHGAIISQRDQTFLQLHELKSPF